MLELFFDAKMGGFEKKKQAFRILFVASMSFLSVVNIMKIDVENESFKIDCWVPPGRIFKVLRGSARGQIFDVYLKNPKVTRNHKKKLSKANLSHFSGVCPSPVRKCNRILKYFKGLDMD